MQKSRLDLSNKIIYCICEGNAELELLNILLENNKLIFERDDLLSQKFFKRESGKKLAKNLDFDFDKKVVIVRILDSRNEKLSLPRLYDEMYNERYKCLTRPEIEIIIIMLNEDEKEYIKSHLKPSEFCKKKYGYSKNKGKEFFKSNFSVDELVEVLRKYDKRRKDEYTIYSLIK